MRTLGPALRRRRRPPRVQRLRKMRRDHTRRMELVCLQSVFARGRHGRKPPILFVVKQGPRRPAAAAPRSTKPAACDTAPVCIRTDDTHARRQTLPLRRWSTPHGAERPLRRRPLRRHRALQHGRPTRASYWRTPHAHAHCLELPVILLSFACIPACLAQALYSRRIPLHASIRDTKLAHALKRFRPHRDHTAKDACMRLPRT